MTDQDSVETCPKCGGEIRVGFWPYCPHGEYRGGIIADALSGGGQWIENLDNSPVWVETKTQLRAEAAKRGLRWDPKPQPKGVKILNPDNDVRGRFNGGALPTYREHYVPASGGDTGER